MVTCIITHNRLHGEHDEHQTDEILNICIRNDKAFILKYE